jgi:hypothetical protein
LYTNSVVEKTNGTAFNPTTTLKLIYISPIDCAFKKNVKYYISLSTQYILLIGEEPNLFWGHYHYAV